MTHAGPVAPASVSLRCGSISIDEVLKGVRRGWKRARREGAPQGGPEVPDHRRGVRRRLRRSTARRCRARRVRPVADRPRHDQLDRHRRGDRRCPAWSPSTPQPISSCSRTPSAFNPAVARTLLASGKVRWVGEPMAVVLAETYEQATDAAQAIYADIEPLPALIDVEQALASDVLHLPRRRQQRRVRLGRDGRQAPTPARSSSRAARSSSTSGSSTSACAPCPLEPRGGAAVWHDGRLLVWISTQHAQGALAPIAGVAGRRAGPGPDHDARRRRWIRRQDRLLLRGAAARLAGAAAPVDRCGSRRPAASR